LKAHLINLWDRMRGSYWFIPACAILFALAAAAGLPALDNRYAEAFDDALGMFRLGPDSARTLLSTVASVMATVVGLVFSLTILTLSIATSQFGPRLLRSFLNNRATQIVLGTFVATVIYSLLILAMIHAARDTEIVPHISVFAALFAAVFNLVFLVHFVNSIAELIQAPNVVARVAADLDDALLRLCPEKLPDNPEDEHAASVTLPGPGTTIYAHKEGYLQGVDIEELTNMAAAAGFVLRLHYRPGQFVYLSSPLAEAYEFQDDVNGLEESVNRSIVTGRRRSPRQDVECTLLELVEVAVRALSPGVNDPFTAINCLDHLGAILGRAATRALPPAACYDNNGTLRVLMPFATFADLLDAGCNQIRQNGEGNTAVLIRLLEALAQVAHHVLRTTDGEALRRHVEMVARACEATIKEPNDLEDIRDRVEAIYALLNKGALKPAANCPQ